MTTDTNSIVPFDKFETGHTYPQVSSQPAQRYIYRVHRKAGHGALVPGVGFRASACAGGPWDTPDTQYSGDRVFIASKAAEHITQCKDRTWTQPMDFVSDSYSLPYALFEARRRELRDSQSRIHISVIDTWKLKADAWLGTELVGAWWVDAAFFARWAEEVLVYRQINHDAVVITMPADDFFRLLPDWCGQFQDKIHRGCFWSTEAVAHKLRLLVQRRLALSVEDNNTVHVADVLLENSVRRSITLLEHVLPNNMLFFDEDAHQDAVDTMAGFAAIFCWWPQ